MENIQIFKKTRNYLISHGFPSGDYDSNMLPMKEFDAGGHYGIELSSMNNLNILLRTLKLTEQYNVKLSRVIECRGIVRLPDAEVKEMVKVCEKERIGLTMSIGPRAISDIGAFVNSPNGKRIGYRLRGMENIIHATEDLKRGIELGVRGFLIYDEGLLYLFNKMRKDGEIPKDVILKYSVHAGCSNPLSAKLLEENGCDTINIIPDLEVGMIKAFRKTIKVPLDIFSDTAKSAGGLLRTYDMPKVIQVASPVYLKCGPISQPDQNHLPSADELEERVKQARIVVEHVERYLPSAKMVSIDEKTLAIPRG